MRSFYMHFRLPSTVAQRQLLRTGDFTNYGTVWVTAMFRQQGVSGQGASHRMVQRQRGSRRTL